MPIFTHTKKGLALKFILTISLLMVVTSLGLGIFFFRHESGVFKDNLERIGKSLSRNLGYSAEYGVLINNKEMLATLLEGVIEEEDVAYCLIQGLNGDILAKKEKKALAISLEAKREISNKALQVKDSLIQSFVTERKKLIYDVASPIMTKRFIGNKTQKEVFHEDDLFAQDSYSNRDDFVIEKKS